MSKKAKKAAKNKRLVAKRQKKQAQKDRYKKYAELGQNTKSKRARRKGQKTARMTSHPDGRCGNPACEKCFGVRFGGWLNEAKNALLPGHPHRLWLRWTQAQA